MKTSLRYKVYLILSLIFSAISSSAILLCMLKVEESAEKSLMIIISTMFWLGLILEQVFIWLVNGLRKNMQSRAEKINISGYPGICSFFKSEFGFFTDVVLIISIIALIVLNIGKWELENLNFIFLFLLVLSFRLHCIANGKNYRYKRYLIQRRENDD